MANKCHPSCRLTALTKTFLWFGSDAIVDNIAWERYFAVVFPSPKTLRRENLGTAATGVHHTAKITAQCNCIFHIVDQQNDIGIDAYIEFILGEEATGCCIALQIKSGNSYCLASGWRIRAEVKHLNYWRSHSLPVCGIVYDPQNDSARWVDISKFLAEHPGLERGCDIPVPHQNAFTLDAFPAFREHFLASRARFSDDAHFGRSLQQLSHLEQIGICDAALRALFSFRRNRPEAWFFLIASIPILRGHPVLRNLAIALSHIPGHGDIFWHPKNIISSESNQKALDLLKRHLSRDAVISLLSVVDPETGFERGSIGQCVLAIVLASPSRNKLLRSILFDDELSENLRFWSVLLLIYSEQRRDVRELISTLETAKSQFTEDNLERVLGLMDCLKKDGCVHFW